MQRPSPDSSGDKERERRNAGYRREIMRYTGISMQVCVSVGLSIFLGIKADKWTKLSFPIFSWALPLLVIVVLIIQLVKETTRNKDEK